MKVDFESLDSIPSMLSDRSDLAFQPGSSGHISDHMNRQAFHRKFWICLEFKPSTRYLWSRVSLMLSLCAREVELVEKMFLIENSGCRWTQTSLQMSRRRKQDLYLEFEYWHNIAADESMIPLIQTGSVEFDLLKNMLTRDNLQNVNISQIFPRSSSYKIRLMTSHIEWTRWMCFGDMECNHIINVIMQTWTVITNIRRFLIYLAIWNFANISGSRPNDWFA